MVYPRAHSWCCTLSGFGQMCNDIEPSLSYHKEYFHCPKNPLCSSYSAFPNPPPSKTTAVFTVPVVVPFPDCHRVRTMRCVAFPDWLSLSDSMPCLGFTAHLFLAPDDDISLSGYTTGSLSSHLLTDILVASKFWQL